MASKQVTGMDKKHGTYPARLIFHILVFGGRLQELQNVKWATLGRKDARIHSA